MKATSVASSGIVHEVLTRDNYERWSVVMQNYLRGEGLWDVVQSANSEVDIEKGLSSIDQSVPEVETEALWKMSMKDAKALHIIQLSCGLKILDEISQFKTAKEAWNYLSKQYRKDLKVNPDTEQANSLDQLRELFRKAGGSHTGETGMVSDISLTSASGRWTLLHTAAIDGNVDEVEMLIREGKDQLLGMTDKHGYTALALAAHYTGDTDIAKCMVESKNGITREWLLETENNEGEIPVLLAAAHRHKEMTTYLYSKTPGEVFHGDSRNRVLLLARCITAQIFDVALGLLKSFPYLPRESLLGEFPAPDLLRKSLCGNLSILDALAKMPFAFPSDSKLGSLQQPIYDDLTIEEGEFGDRYGSANFVLSVKDVLTRVEAVADKRRQEISFGDRLRRGLSGLLLQSLLSPEMVLGQLLRGILRGVRRGVRGLIHVIHTWPGINRETIYAQKYAHYEVLGILNYFSKSIADFNNLELREASAYVAMLHAAEHGTIEFINAMREANPDLLLATDSCHRDIFSYSIMYRKKNIFKLIHSLAGQKEIFRCRTDAFGNNMLHLAAHLGHSSDLNISRLGAALQMQREIQWFKAVEEVVHPMCKEAKNRDGKKPHELFTEHHEDLVKEGEKWAKDTAKSYTIVGTLIMTMMFAAAFGVPGGNDQDGLPIFLHDKIFTTFLVADAVSLFTSSISVLVFIEIMTSGFPEKDFYEWLPLVLQVSLSFLVISVCTMMLTFAAALGLISMGYEEQSRPGALVGAALLGFYPLIYYGVPKLRSIFYILSCTFENPISST